MAFNFFDTSALAKHYHTETGTLKVDRLLAMTADTHGISRLSFVELQSVFAKKLRTGQISLTVFRGVIRRFQADVAAKRFRVLRLLVPHLRAAEGLIRRIGPTQDLRTLDAIQLATALHVVGSTTSVNFVSADHALGAIATAEGLTVINPELP